MLSQEEAALGLLQAQPAGISNRGTGGTLDAAFCPTDHLWAGSNMSAAGWHAQCQQQGQRRRNGEKCLQ